MSQKTKSILIYIGGVVTGIVLMFLFAFIVNVSNRTGGDMNMFDKPQEEIPYTEFSVIQVMPNGNAIAVAEYGTVAVLFLSEGESYYDSQKIIVPEGKVCRQVGTYRYPNQDKMVKTIPIVEIMDE